MQSDKIWFDAELIDYADATFDVVVSNQVFEHIPEEALDGAVAEIHRVLKPGGVFLCLFPTRDVWFEGHLGLYGVHRLPAGGQLRRRVLKTCHRLGLGYYQEQSSADGWAREMERQLDNVIFYHSWQRIGTAWRAAFSQLPDSLAAEYMRFRVGCGRFAPLSGLAGSRFAAPALQWLCHRRAGRVLVIRKTSSASDLDR